ncbi:hypothetical protein [Haloarchaeobius sp. TZWWS8]|uniref:hypothetical protein n=1 Tax=Haloarchaeobius sp. TZWWS8 TaxID=3446121 RepID=UPI003EC0F648
MTGSRAQVAGYDSTRPPFFLSDAQREAMVELGDAVVGNDAGRGEWDEFTVSCSVGLAGTEVVLVDEILRR